MKFVNTHMRTSSNLAVITLLSIVALASFSSTTLATPAKNYKWSFQYTRAANAPSNCATEEYLRTALAANTNGEDPFEKDAPRSISVIIEKLSNEVEARITVRDENGAVTNENTLHGPSWRCDQLAERIVFALQNIVDPLELPSTQASGTPNTPETPSNSGSKNANSSPNNDLTPSSTPKTPMKRQRSSMIPQVGLSLAVGPAWWNAPETALSSTIGIELLWKRAAVGIEGHYEYAWAVRNLPDSSAERTTVMIVACGLHRWSERFMMRGCGFGDFGKMSVEIQKDDSSNLYAPVADIGARIGVAVWLVPRFGIEFRADAAYAIVRPQVHMQDDRLWRAAPFTGALRVAFLGAFDIF